jgi:hypothetical protein
MDDLLSQKRARRALELGRIRHALVGAALVTAALAILSRLVPSSVDPRGLAFPFAAWALVAWRGGALARGGVTGLVAGVAGWLVPMSVLRPCCAAMSTMSTTPGADCCTRPECCLETGALLGVIVALIVPLGLGRDRRSSTSSIAGTFLVAAATLGVRCTSLFVGESIGLLGGLALGALGAGLARTWLVRPVTTGVQP